VGLTARALELEGIRSVTTSWFGKAVRSSLPPRASLTHMKRGCTLGAPNNHAQQRRILESTLELLAEPAPLNFLKLNER